MALLRKKSAGCCPKCGNPIDLEHQAYCLRWGNQLQKRKKGKRLGLIKIIIIILIILASIAAVRYFLGKPILPDFSILKNASG